MTSLRDALTRKLAARLAVLLALTGLAVYFTTRAALVAQFDATLLAKAMAIRMATQQEEGQIVLEQPELLPGHPAATADVFQLWAPDGATIARSRVLGDQTLTRPTDLSRVPLLWDLGWPFGGRARAVGVMFDPYLSAEEREDRRPPLRAISLVVASNRSDLDRTLLTLAFVLSVGGGLLTFAAVGIVRSVVRRELQPVEQLAHQTAQIDARTLNTRIPTQTMPAELVPIGRGLNDLLARLESSFERERQFSANVAHELRTPIAELRTLAELALNWPETRDPQMVHDALDIAKYMEGLVTRLLTLLRSEDGLVTGSAEPIAIDRLVGDVVRPLADRIKQKHLRMISNVPETTTVDSDPVLLRAVLANVLENAVEYTPDGGRIELVLSVEQEGFIIRVTNDVESFAEEHVGRLFDRFWRQDLSRTGNDHYGLGLPLARAFARALNGNLTAQLESSSRVTLVFTGPAHVRRH